MPHCKLRLRLDMHASRNVSFCFYQKLRSFSVHYDRVFFFLPLESFFLESMNYFAAKLNRGVSLSLTLSLFFSLPLYISLTYFHEKFRNSFVLYLLLPFDCSVLKVLKYVHAIFSETNVLRKCEKVYHIDLFEKI